MVLVGLCLTIALTEIGLRWNGMFHTLSEKQSFGQYNSVRTREYLDTWLWRHGSNEQITEVRPEFTFNRTTNSLGISEKEISPKSNKFRIIGIGDSFTEGYGVSSNDTWLKVMERELSDLGFGDSIETVNAGIGGSDLVYAYALFEKKLLTFEPDLVILSINSSDVFDIGFRGGFERFKEDGTVGIPPPSWESIYMLSHIIRLVVHNLLDYSDYLIPNKTHTQNRARFTEIAFEALSKFKLLSEKSGFDLVIVVQPILSDFDTDSYSVNEFVSFTQTLDATDIPAVYLKDCFADNGVMNRNQAEEFFWPIDGHFNKSGYEVYGKCVAEKLPFSIN